MLRVKCQIKVNFVWCGRHRAIPKMVRLVFGELTGVCITEYASFHPGGVTCDARPKITLLLGKSGLGADT